ncbi:DEAD/DEAH box helicase [Saxibacter everestensis]|uniref:RNA helicase n=1 Tax=Saxibacter everestensis TaxID=2909229 RepID=A0ABY8QQ15_9MICO|nr:DEAD/DEAH box helicase [Brevibacteriaceae bacterium ZFBP1038]
MTTFDDTTAAEPEITDAAHTIEVTAPAAPVEITFADLGVDAAIVSALAKKGITHPFPIQAMTLPVALTGADIIGQAKTGTGKTLGFGIPLLQRVITATEPGAEKIKNPGQPQALVVVPTRELAGQVAEDLKAASADRDVRIVTIYGGRAFEPQVEALKRGVDVVVGTPGRLLDLHGQRLLTFGSVRTAVFDEADEMLDLGFLPDVEKLVSALPAIRQTMLFSATMPGAVINLARRYMTQPTHIRAAEPDDAGATVKNTKQHVFRAHAMDKSEVVARILQAEGRGRSIIFTRTKRTAAKLADELTDRGFAAGALHGDLGQGAREQALRAFRNNKVDVLVATDVAARGIDVDDVTHVINYQCPEDEKTYLHRIGRTGRAGNKGIAITFVDWDDLPRWGLIDRTLDLGLDEPVETYSTSGHLFTDLDIPAGTKGRLPKGKRTLEGLGGETLEDLGETGKHTARATGRDRRPGADRSKSQRHDETAPRGAAEKPSRAAAAEDRPRRRRRRTVNGTPSESGQPSSEAAPVGADGNDSGSAPTRRRRRVSRSASSSAEGTNDA